VDYAGQELSVFAEAVRWKRYIARELEAFLVGDVLEVGAGIGSVTRALRSDRQRSWTCLEPDPKLAAELQSSLASAAAPSGAPVSVRIGTVDSIDPGALYDCVLYIDVLEHIEADAVEVQQAIGLLRIGGALVVLSPAHQWLYSPFDKAIGHFRRYNRRMLAALTPQGAHVEQLRYLDSVGLLASAGNRVLLQSAQPTIQQIRLWDRVMVPCSRLLDPLLQHRVGKSVVCVWRKV
jgi:2-polyprenyl-3-methyl-5-hydroxy-6-metoxy-1,4-benzoquinol methylase